RKSDSKTLKRWRCYDCLKTCSQASESACYRQNRRRLNPLIGKLLSSGVSQRRAAMIAGTTRKTVARKFIFLAEQAQQRQSEFVQEIDAVELAHIQLDDLITSHHSKLKPLSLSVIVSKRSRYILSASLSEIPAFGHLAQFSRRKYGK